MFRLSLSLSSTTGSSENNAVAKRASSPGFFAAGLLSVGLASTGAGGTDVNWVLQPPLFRGALIQREALAVELGLPIPRGCDQFRPRLLFGHCAVALLNSAEFPDSCLEYHDRSSGTVLYLGQNAALFIQQKRANRQWHLHSYYAAAFLQRFLFHDPQYRQGHDRVSRMRP